MFRIRFWDRQGTVSFEEKGIELFMEVIFCNCNSDCTPQAVRPLVTLIREINNESVWDFENQLW